MHKNTALRRRALITGITGQDGSYLAELLLAKGYEVHGIIRRVAMEDPGHRLWRINHIQDRIILHPASLESFPSIFRVINEVKPEECYHLAAQSFVSYSFDDEFSTINTNINGTHFVLAALKDLAPACRFYFAGSSEMFGHVTETPQTETTPFNPRTPYGISKVAGFHLTKNYREAYGMFAIAGILFNHESPRRGFEYVTRKITRAAAQIRLGQATELRLGNLDSRRDWGYSPDYVKAMWLMVQQDIPVDRVIATGETHSVRELLEVAFDCIGLDWRHYVVPDNRLLRPVENYELRGNAEKARRELGWYLTTSFADMIRGMIQADIDALRVNGDRAGQRLRLQQESTPGYD